VKTSGKNCLYYGWGILINKADFPAYGKVWWGRRN